MATSQSQTFHCCNGVINEAGFVDGILQGQIDRCCPYLLVAKLDKLYNINLYYFHMFQTTRQLVRLKKPGSVLNFLRLSGPTLTRHTPTLTRKRHILVQYLQRDIYRFLKSTKDTTKRNPCSSTSLSSFLTCFSETAVRVDRDGNVILVREGECRVDHRRGRSPILGTSAERHRWENDFRQGGSL